LIIIIIIIIMGEGQMENV